MTTTDFRSMLTAGALLLGLAGCKDPPSTDCDDDDATVSDDDDAATPDVLNSDLMQVVAGGFHSCAIVVGGVVGCWGGNDYGQSSPPNDHFHQLAAGSFHTCGIDYENHVQCWGSNHYGQSRPPDGEFVQIAASAWHSCGIKQDGTAVCWGCEGVHEVFPYYGLPSYESTDYGQCSVNPTIPMAHIATGPFHTCGISAEDGIALCWGTNSYGQAAAQSGPFTQLSASYHTCGVRTDDGLECWAEDVYGETVVPQEYRYKQVANGRLFTCAITDTDHILCFGNNTFGQTNAPIGEFTQIDAGDSHACALSSAQRFTCWGNNETGQLSPGS